MKLLQIAWRLTALIAALAGAACTRSSARPSHWYYIKTANSGEFAATSPLGPAELAKAVAETSFIRFEDFRDFNGAGHWAPSKAPFRGVVFVRPQEIKSFELLEAPPKDFNLQEAR